MFEVPCRHSELVLLASAPPQVLAFIFEHFPINAHTKVFIYGTDFVIEFI